MQINKDRLGKEQKQRNGLRPFLSSVRLRRTSALRLASEQGKGGRRLEISSCRLQDRIGSRQYAVGKIKLLIANCLLLSLFCFLPTANCQLPTAFADEITIRTIVTPIGSQSEKWGAAGLMVCIGGETIPNGGCGSVTKGWKINEAGNKEEIEIKDNDIVIFKDTSDGSGGGPNHQFDAFSSSWSDDIYEVRGSGGEGIIIGACVDRVGGTWVQDCMDAWGDAYCEGYIRPGSVPPETLYRCECSTGDKKIFHVDISIGTNKRAFYLCVK